MMPKIKYPIGIQSFSELRNGGYVYIDKTPFVYKLVTEGKYYFLSRPRRFGKSLMISTLEALFQGRKELFDGLYLDTCDWDWQSHEVLHVDLNVQNYRDDDSLSAILEWHLKKWEALYGITDTAPKLENRFADIIIKAYDISGRGVVILVDEYDKPLLSNVDNQDRQNMFRNQLQAFYSVLKSLDRYIKFGMLTGVSRFSKVSVFSSLNNLRDISLESDFNSICGITEQELTQYFETGMQDMARKMEISVDELHNQLKSNYDGYHFAADGADIYNPFSLLNTFSSCRIGSYWMSTGTTSSLLDILKVNTYPIRNLEGCQCSESLLNGADIFLSDPIPFFFQAGYLTIKGYDPEFREYTLGFPNKEVAQGFNDLVLKTWMRNKEPITLISTFVKDVRSGLVDRFMNKLQSFFADIPYEHASEKKFSDERVCGRFEGSREVHYQNVLYVIMRLMGFYTRTEYRTSNGRIDLVVETDDYIYILEFKINSSAEKALRQINEKKYALAFHNTGKKIFKIGANFSTRTRRLTQWVCEAE